MNPIESKMNPIESKMNPNESKNKLNKFECIYCVSFILLIVICINILKYAKKRIKTAR